MTDYIKRADALAAIDCGNLHRGIVDALQSLILDVHAADVRPVVHGKWIHETIDTHSSITGKVYLPPAICSICGNSTILEANFCPYCGADMREEVPGHE